MYIPHHLDACSSLLLVATTLSMLLTSVSSQNTLPRYLFIFGDSYSANGFDFNSTPPQYFPGNPFGNPAFPGVTTSGGTNWVGYLVQQLSPPNTLAYNYAGFGASVNETLVGGGAYKRNFNDQVAYFLDGPAKQTVLSVPWTVYQNFFIIWFGVNDIRDSIDDVQKIGNSPDLLYTQVLDFYFNNMHLLYNAGARRFLVLDVPPFNRSQYSVVLGSSTHATISKTIPSFNKNLRARVDSFLRAHSDARLQIFDTSGTFNDILDNPQAWGAPNNTCAEPNGVACLWWDPLHPGRAIQYSLGSKLHSYLKSQGFYSSVDQWTSKSQKLFAQLQSSGIPVA